MTDHYYPATEANRRLQAALEEIEDLKERLEAWRIYGKEAQEIFGYSTHEDPWFKALQDLGELP